MAYSACWFYRRGLAIAMTLLLMAVLCPGQDNPSTPSSRDQDSALTIGPIHNDEVMIHATVYNKHHQPVGELALNDFTVYEDARRETITAFGADGSGYFFAYKPTNDLSNGGTRIITIKVHKRGMRVQAPKSYSADASNSGQDRSGIPNSLASPRP